MQSLGLLRTLCKNDGTVSIIFQRLYSTKHFVTSHSCHVLVAGGGTAGCTIAAKAVKHFDKNDVIIVEPKGTHYYQPLFTLIGGGVCSLESSRKPMNNVLPSEAKWIQDSIASFSPEENFVTTATGDKIYYDYLVIATGIETRFDLVPGLEEALNDSSSGVCSNYSSKYVSKTFQVLKNFESGNAIFTLPNTPVKCAGAPQKICYLAESYFTKNGNREKANVKYFTATPVLFSCKKYADELHRICSRRNIEVNLKHNLKEVLPKSKEAVFEILDKPGETVNIPFSMLHVTPPMTAPAALKTGLNLTDANGFVNVNKETLQHVHYSNIFSLGDCSNLPTSKTAAAVAAQSSILWNNLFALLDGKSMKASYNGYTSCPLVTSYNSVIMAEFDYNLQPAETFPFNQGVERRSMFLMKKNVLPFLYWKAMLKGLWNGPGIFRKLFHPSLLLKKAEK